MKKKINCSDYCIDFNKKYIVAMSKIGDKERKLKDCVYVEATLKPVENTYLIEVSAIGCQNSYFDIKYLDFLIKTGKVTEV